MVVCMPEQDRKKSGLRRGARQARPSSRGARPADASCCTGAPLLLLLLLLLAALSCWIFSASVRRSPVPGPVNAIRASWSTPEGAGCVVCAPNTESLPALRGPAVCGKLDDARRPCECTGRSDGTAAWFREAWPSGGERAVEDEEDERERPRARALPPRAGMRMLGLLGWGMADGMSSIAAEGVGGFSPQSCCCWVSGDAKKDEEAWSGVPGQLTLPPLPPCRDMGASLDRQLPEVRQLSRACCCCCCCCVMRGDACRDSLRGMVGGDVSGDVVLWCRRRAPDGGARANGVPSSRVSTSVLASDSRSARAMWSLTSTRGNERDAGATQYASNHFRASPGQGVSANPAERSRADSVYIFGVCPLASIFTKVASAVVISAGRWLAQAFSTELK